MRLQAYLTTFLSCACAVASADIQYAAHAADLRTCMVSVADLPSWRSSKNLVVVDTRAADEYRAARVSNSVNLPAYALKAKTYLVDKRVLLIGRAGSGAELEPTCSRLRAAGFASVGILEGGLSLWAREVGTIVGDRTSRRSLSRLTAADFARDPRADDWLVVDISPDGVAASQLGLGRVVRIPFDTPARFRAAVGDAIRRCDAPQSPFVLLVDGDLERDERVASAAASLALPHVYFLGGGVEDHRRFEAREGYAIRAGGHDRSGKVCGSR